MCDNSTSKIFKAHHTSWKSLNGTNTSPWRLSPLIPHDNSLSANCTNPSGTQKLSKILQVTAWQSVTMSTWGLSQPSPHVSAPTHSHTCKSDPKKLSKFLQVSALQSMPTSLLTLSKHSKHQQICSTQQAHNGEGAVGCNHGMLQNDNFSSGIGWHFRDGLGTANLENWTPLNKHNFVMTCTLLLHKMSAKPSRSQHDNLLQQHFWNFSSAAHLKGVTQLNKHIPMKTLTTLSPWQFTLG